MLILSRKKNESVMIDDCIQVTVLGLKGNNIILGFTAPRTVPVHREEVYLRNQLFSLKTKESYKTQSLPKSNYLKNKDLVKTSLHCEMEK